MPESPRLFEFKGFVAEGLRTQGRLQGLARGLLRGLERGLERGYANGQRRSLHLLLDSKGIHLTTAQRALVESTDRPDLLTTWFSRALHATTAHAIFSPETTPIPPPAPHTPHP